MRLNTFEQTDSLTIHHASLFQGDTTVSSYEVTTQPPYFYSAGSFNSDQTHQGFCFMSKLACDVRRVEFAKAWRLSKNSMEQVSFKVPRVKVSEEIKNNISRPTSVLLVFFLKSRIAIVAGNFLHCC